MAKRPIVILHGWSDNSRSFTRLARLITQHSGRKVTAVYLGDYISMDDSVTMADLCAAMQRAWLDNKLPIAVGSVDAIVHSTGGLVIRDWMTRFFMPETVPIKHLVMLAPANFGSPLAHKGRAFLGRILKGIHSRKLFQTGTHILKALELASPYTWALAERDRFSRHVYYGKGKILCTVLVGNTGYTGIAAAANEAGSDGTVRISTANLNCAYVEADFEADPLNPQYQLKKSKGITAFGICDQENHTSITCQQGGPHNKTTLERICQALAVTDEEFPAWCQTLRKQNRALAKQDKQDHFQNTVVFLTDQFNNHITDYFLEFRCEDLKKRDNQWFEALFHDRIIKTTHCYQADTSYRSLYVNASLLYKELAAHLPTLSISLTAMPEFKLNKVVGYRTFDKNDIGAIQLTPEHSKMLFVPDRSLLVKACIKRHQASNLFQFKRN